MSAAAAAAAAKRKRGRTNKAPESGTSSEEERWLDAIASGKLEQVDDEMRKLKDPKLMTARQRAMYERSSTSVAAINTTTPANYSTDDPNPFGPDMLSRAVLATETVNVIDQQLVALPSGYKETKILSAEDIEKAQLKSLKRKQLADEKREKNKRKTMERLLKKKDYKSVAASAKAAKLRPVVAKVPMITWRSDTAGTRIIFPPGVELPLLRANVTGAVCVVGCSICGAPKRYNCSRTHVPLCSFDCYKANVARLKEVMC